jgi:phosphate transport system permease protein
MSAILLRVNILFRCYVDQWLAPFLGLLAAGVALIVLLVLGFLLAEAWPAFTVHGWLRFFTDDGWYPNENRFGLAPMLWSSLVASAGALLIAVPFGIAAALFACYYAPVSIAGFYRGMLGILAGVPSVVYGLWGLTVLVPTLAAWQAPGTSLLAAIFILALMIIPTIALTSISALQALPLSLSQGCAALGMTRHGTIMGVLIPSARREIVGGIMLACARALGETMAVLMVAGNVVQNPSGLFLPVRVLTANIALEMSYASGLHRAGLFASGLMLTLLVLTLAWAAAVKRD